MRHAMFLLVTAILMTVPAADSDIAFVSPGGGLVVTGPDGEVVRITPQVWGPGWTWTGLKADIREVDGASTIRCTGTMGGTKVPFTLDLRIAQTSPNVCALTWELSSQGGTDLTLAVLGISPGGRFNGTGRAQVIAAEGGIPRDIPFGKEPLGSAVRELRCTADESGALSLVCDPVAVMLADGQARLVMAAEHLDPGPIRGALILTLPGPVAWYPTPDKVPFPPDWDRWFPWSPSGKVGDPTGGLDMREWLDAPAGSHGRVRREGDRLVVGDRPIRFWGLNLCYSACAPEHELADRRAEFYARHGVNAVRLHKYADGTGWAGIQSADSFATFDEAALERFDYFVAALKQRGIYVELSPHFMVKLGPGDREAVPYMDEFGSLPGRNGSRLDTKHGSIFLATELQDLVIRQMTTLLDHRNPYTGLTYAEDPAILMIELFNEDSALFFGTMRVLQDVPTLRKRAGDAFTHWLKQRYATQADLIAAWGPEALDSFKNERLTGESWEENSIIPAGNPWFYDPDQLAGSQAAKKARLLDTMRFLYETQNAFYDRYVAALRAAGYQGEFVASNWHAGRSFSHFLNLHSDARIGLIDRHNYQGKSGSLLGTAGSGMLSSGMQQVEGLPFSLSEWIHVFPNEWGAEGPVILGAYGLGLQGWDISFIFQNRDQGTWSERIGREEWDAVAPQVWATFPAVARQVRRGDVAPAAVTTLRRVQVDSLGKGEIGFDDRVRQDQDVKELDSSMVSSRSLAVARCTVAFTQGPEATEPFDLSPFVQGGELVSSTKQLSWREGEKARVRIDTPSTQAVIGAATEEVIACTDVTVTTHTPWAYVSLTVAGPEGTIATAPRLLVTTVARARNDGMRVVGGEVLVPGAAPIRLEPVAVDLILRRPGAPVVHILDHDGQRSGRQIPVKDGRISLDSGETQAVWYEIVY